MKNYLKTILYIVCTMLLFIISISFITYFILTKNIQIYFLHILSLIFTILFIVFIIKDECSDKIKLNTTQKYLKQFIPNDDYCDDCPFFHDLNKQGQDLTIPHLKKFCNYKCTEDCTECDEIITYCSFFNIIEYGDYPLGDACKLPECKKILN